MTPWEFSAIYKGKQEFTKGLLEGVSDAFKVALASALQGKDIPLFKEDSAQDSEQSNRVTKEEKEKVLADLDQQFN